MVELLITVAIISVLATLLVTGFTKTSARANAMKCTSNMRQVSAALLSYAGEHNGQLPPVAEEWPPTSGPDWYFNVWPYAGYDTTNYDVDAGPRAKATPRKGGDNIFRCPVTRRNPIAAPTVGSVNPNRYSYGLNTYLYPTNKPSPVSLARLETPSQTVMLSETSYILGARSFYLEYHGMTPHDKGANFAFFDGHVEWRKFDKLPTNASDPFWKLPDRVE